MLDIDKLRIYAIMRNPIFNIVDYSHCVWFNVHVGRMFISLAPWLGCYCIMESKCIGPTFKVNTQSTRVPIAFKYSSCIIGSSLSSHTLLLVDFTSWIYSVQNPRISQWHTQLTCSLLIELYFLHTLLGLSCTAPCGVHPPSVYEPTNIKLFYEVDY